MNKKAFSLVELLCVVAILTILATITLSIGNKCIHRTKVKTKSVGAQHLATVSYLCEDENDYLDKINYRKTESMLLGAED